MTESVEVRPRFTDNDMQESVAPPAESQTQAVATAARGLFTSMYENKIIVLIIIVTIIIIAFVAYFVFKKEPDTQQVHNTKQAAPKPAAVEPTSNQTPEETVSKPTHNDLVKKADPNALKELLNRSKTASRPVETTEDDITNSQSKTDSEVMDLMEDNNEDTNVEDNEETHEESNESNEINESFSSETINGGSTCSAMLQSGRQCKNRAKTEGKCAKHLD